MILNQFRLDNQIAVITGGSKGLEKAIAIGLAEIGADIAVVTRGESPELNETLNLGCRRQRSIMPFPPR